VVILTRDEMIHGVADVIAMPTTSFLVAENTLSAEKVFLIALMTELGAAKMDEVCRALAVATSCG
jgi:hypothetical protein